MIHEGSMDIVSRCNELLYHEFKVHLNFLKGKGACSSRFRVPVGHTMDGCWLQIQINVKCLVVLQGGLS